MTDYLENKILNVLFRADAAYKPAAIYIGLFTADPTDAGLFTNEVTGSGYARVAVTQNASSWSVPTDVGGNQSTSNVAAINFGTALGNWGTITHVAVIDASVAGNILQVAQLAMSKTVSTGDGFQLPANSLSFYAG